MSDSTSKANIIVSSFLPEHFREYVPDAPYFWNIDAGTVNDGMIALSGWALPFFGEAGNLTLRINGEPFASTEILESPGVAEHFPWWPNTGNCRFRVEHPEASLADSEDWRIEVAPREKVGVAASYEDALAIYLPRNEVATPSGNLLQTIGGGDAFKYRLGGRTLFHRFQNALRAETGHGFSTVGRILDWGCGPGRIAAHVIPELESADDFTGAEIVSKSVEFANKEIAPRFKLCEVSPPLPLEPASLDCVYAYSVLTHIPGEMLRDWVAEVARVLKPGGVALLTTMGELAFAHFRTGRGEAAFRDWLEAGVSDEVANDQLADTNVPEGYYRNTWIPEASMRELCDGLFDVQRVIKNFYFYQDMFVLRRV